MASHKEQVVGNVIKLLQIHPDPMDWGRDVNEISEPEQLELANRMFKGDSEAQQQLIEANLRLVAKAAEENVLRGHIYGITLTDLITSGTIGLIKAVEGLTPDMIKTTTLRAFVVGAIEAEIEADLQRIESRSQPRSANIRVSRESQHMTPLPAPHSRSMQLIMRKSLLTEYRPFAPGHQPRPAPNRPPKPGR